MEWRDFFSFLESLEATDCSSSSNFSLIQLKWCSTRWGNANAGASLFDDILPFLVLDALGIQEEESTVLGISEVEMMVLGSSGAATAASWSMLLLRFTDFQNDCISRWRLVCVLRLFLRKAFRSSIKQFLQPLSRLAIYSESEGLMGIAFVLFLSSCVAIKHALMYIPQKPLQSTPSKSLTTKTQEQALAMSWWRLTQWLKVSMDLREVRKSLRSDSSVISMIMGSSCCTRLTANMMRPKLPTAITKSHTYFTSSLGKLYTQKVMNHLQTHMDGSTPSSTNMCVQSRCLSRLRAFWKRRLKMEQSGKPSSYMPSSMYLLLQARCTNISKHSFSEQPTTTRKLTIKLMPCVQPILGKWLAMRFSTLSNCLLLGYATGNSKVRSMSFSICTKQSWAMIPLSSCISASYCLLAMFVADSGISQLSPRQSQQLLSSRSSPHSRSRHLSSTQGETGSPFTSLVLVGRWNASGSRWQ